MRLRSFRRGGHNGVMHVISGRFKGVALTTPKTGTRPTTDRTKEAIFSHLDSWQVLDAPAYWICSPGPGRWASRR